MGRYLNSINWSILDSLENCEDKLELMTNLIINGLNHIMPIERVKVHVNDCPWITPNFKELIRHRQNAFISGDTVRFRKFRNLINRERKILRKKFFTSKVSQLKQVSPSQWWGAVKRISGMSSLSGSQDLISQLNIQDFVDLSPQVIANKINEAFLEPMQPFRPLECPPVTNEVQSVFVTEPYVLNELRRLTCNKATGADGIPNWLLKEYADILSYPITSVLNSSFAEQCLPTRWKNADVIPVPKKKPVNDIKNQLRPISLTPSMSKIAEDFVIKFHIGPAVLKVIDPDQFGAIPKSSTEQAPISILHYLSRETDGTSAAVRLVLFDYRKAFDLIDHYLLVQKLSSLDIPCWVKNWVTDFLTDRNQRVKLSRNCFSDSGSVPSGVPQGTKLGPWLFLLMINDLKVPNVPIWKYVDDTSIAETVPKGALSNAQAAVTSVENWSRENRMKLHPGKCKELIVDFSKNKQVFDPITVDGVRIPVVSKASVLGITISNNLLWNDHVTETIKKANKRLYSLVLLKRAGVPLMDIKNFYCATIRPVLEYCSPVFHHALPQYLSAEIERVQKRALSIMNPSHTYEANLAQFGLVTLHKRRQELCDNQFERISTTSHKLSYLLPPNHCPNRHLRKCHEYDLPQIHTDRFKHSFIPAMCAKKFLKT